MCGLDLLVYVDVTGSWLNLHTRRSSDAVETETVTKRDTLQGGKRLQGGILVLTRAAAAHAAAQARTACRTAGIPDTLHFRPRFQWVHETQNK